MKYKSIQKLKLSILHLYSAGMGTQKILLYIRPQGLKSMWELIDYNIKLGCSLLIGMKVHLSLFIKKK